MGRCCSLSTRSTCRNPRPTCTHHHRTAVHFLYPIPYASIYIQYILLPPPTCFSVPTLLTPVTVTLWAQCIPIKLFLYVSCIYHLMSVYIMYIYQMHAVYNTCCFPSPSITQPSPIPKAFLVWISYLAVNLQNKHLPNSEVCITSFEGFLSCTINDDKNTKTGCVTCYLCIWHWLTAWTYCKI